MQPVIPLWLCQALKKLGSIAGRNAKVTFRNRRLGMLIYKFEGGNFGHR
jgi:hypothetical protein